MLLNNVPHSRLARNFIYEGAAEALVAAVQDPDVPRRMKVCVYDKAIVGLHLRENYCRSMYMINLL